MACLWRPALFGSLAAATAASRCRTTGSGCNAFCPVLSHSTLHASSVDAAMGLSPLSDVAHVFASSRRPRPCSFVQGCLATFALAAAVVRTRRRGVARAAVREKKEAEAAMLEAVLLKMFDESDEPDILQMRETITRLAMLTPLPNSQVVGDWIIYWASREGCVDRVFGTGMTIEADGVFGFGGMQMQEFLLHFSSKKEGRACEGAEIIRKVGPFPNQSNSLKGKYVIAGTRGLRIEFTGISTDEGNDVELKGEKVSEKVIELEVLYSSKNIVAMQAQDEKGEYDFFVLTPIEDLEKEANRLLGGERRRFFFN